MIAVYDYQVPGDTPGSSSSPHVSIIIPSYDGKREGLLGRLLEDLKDQTFRDFEVLIVQGDNRQGRAINRGVAHSRGEIVMTMDDDTVLGPPELIERLVRALETHPEYGLVGAATEIPSWANPWQKKAMRQIPRRYFPTPPKDRESDMVQHPCLAMRKSLFLAIGGEEEEMPRGLDPLLRYKVRQKGYKVVVVAHTWVYHLLPPTLGQLLKMYFRNGRGSAFAQIHYPHRIVLSGTGYEGNQFKAVLPFPQRVKMALKRWGKALAEGQWIYGLVYFAYVLGYAWGTCFDPG